MNNISQFVCPVCHNQLTYDEKSYFCSNKHLYDISKQGYINLLMSNKSSLSHHGDDKTMVDARTIFLSFGYYERLRDFVCTLALKYAFDNCNICDIGCGEGYYTSKIYDVIKNRYSNPSMSGIDISKVALSSASKRYKEIEFAVASAFKLPYQNESQDLIINMFAPFSVEEFCRIASKNAIMIRVFPSELHLFELKQAIYENPRKNEIDSIEFNGFELLEQHNLCNKILLKNNNEIKSLFYMTPYSYKTSKEDTAKLDNLSALETTIDFNILVYKKS